MVTPAREEFPGADKHRFSFEALLERYEKNAISLSVSGTSSDFIRLKLQM